MSGLTDRFWSKVDKSSDCWLWMAGTNKYGYGKFLYFGKNRLAHRISWMSVNGEIEHDLCVLHHCDNPPCINPEHLFLGTRKDNTADMWAKGRGSFWARSEDNPRRKITNKQAMEIYNSKDTGVSLAKAYKIGVTAISKIKTKTTWRHLHESNGE